MLQRHGGILAERARVISRYPTEDRERDGESDRLSRVTHVQSGMLEWIWFNRDLVNQGLKPFLKKTMTFYMGQHLCSDLDMSVSFRFSWRHRNKFLFCIRSHLGFQKEQYLTGQVRLPLPRANEHATLWSRSNLREVRLTPSREKSLDHLAELELQQRPTGPHLDQDCLPRPRADSRGSTSFSPGPLCLFLLIWPRWTHLLPRDPVPYSLTGILGTDTQA